MSGSNKFLLFFFGIPIVIAIAFLSLSYYLEFRPEKVEYALKIRDGRKDLVDGNIRILSWNIGYAGLGKDADFFLDGGKSSKPDNVETVRNNLDNIKKKISEIDADIIFLQEVDVESSRTFDVLQAFEIAKDNKNMGSYFATNFKTFFVPVPWYSPMGRVWSGIMTFSEFSFKNEMERYSLPESSKWPERMFDLKRCMLVSRMPINENGRELVLVNLHLSAFDDGDLKTQQLEFVIEFLVNEHKKGNMVIAGGDWNHSMPGIEKEHFGSFTTQEENLKWLGRIDEKMTPNGWDWVFDKDNPSVRSNEKGYAKGENFTTVIDGFLVSPGIVVREIKTVVSQFEYSDHEPVVIEISIDKD